MNLGSPKTKYFPLALYKILLSHQIKIERVSSHKNEN